LNLTAKDLTARWLYRQKESHNVDGLAWIEFEDVKDLKQAKRIERRLQRKQARAVSVKYNTRTKKLRIIVNGSIYIEDAVGECMNIFFCDLAKETNASKFKMIQVNTIPRYFGRPA
jgi:GTP-sensing pleiotropic transcriptional regulator CodY